MPNPVTQFQILAKDPDSVATFFSRVFGWTMNADNPLGYRRLDTGSKKGIQGGIWPAPPEAPDFVQLFIEVDDVKAAVARAQKEGAKVLVPPSTLPEGDEMARWRCYSRPTRCRSRCTSRRARGEGIASSHRALPGIVT